MTFFNTVFNMKILYKKTKNAYFYRKKKCLFFIQKKCDFYEKNSVFMEKNRDEFRAVAKLTPKNYSLSTIQHPKTICAIPLRT